MVQSLKELGEARQVVNLSDTVIELIEHMTHKMVFGHSKIERIQLKALAQEALNLAGAFNIADYVRLLGAVRILCGSRFILLRDIYLNIKLTIMI